MIDTINLNGNSHAIVDARLVDNAGGHNSIYRGAYLGSSLTADQAAQISAGTFKDMYIGDYWTINSVNWRIAHFDYHLKKGDTQCTTHHIAIISDSNLLAADGSTTKYMKDSDSTDGGYAGTNYRSTYKSQLETTIGNAFGSSHILTHRQLLCNAVSSGKASGWAWYDCTVEIPSEVQIYGSTIWSNYTDGGSGYNVGTAYPQFALMSLDPSAAINRANYWLRDVASSSWFAGVYYTGYATNFDASNTWVGVRPYFLLA